MADFMDLYRIAVENSFEDNFEKYKDKSIIIYGTGDVARFIMDKYSDYNIIGFLDGNKTYGTFRGKRIFSYEEAVAQKPDIIIVAAKKNHIKEIYDRICYMCYTHNIQLYSIDGRNLFTSFGYGGLSAEQESYWKLNEAMLKEEILNHDSICFDIFDVLLIRKTLLKTDVIEIVNDRLQKKGINIPEYCRLRNELEAEVMATGSNIYDIYRMLASRAGIKPEMAMIALKTELAVEKSILCCRKKMKEILSFAADCGKEVYLISDTYYPADTITEVLDRHGITQYSGMFLSSECKAVKTQDYFSILKSISEGKTCLYITASTEHNYCQDNGVDFFRIASPYDMLLMSSYRNLKYSMDSINERSMAGLLSAKLFNNPFALYKSDGRPEIDKVYDFGYAFVAPLLTKYVIWIIEEAKKGQYDNLLFAARDGYLTLKLYSFAVRQLGLKLPEGIYFQTSRILCTSSTVLEEEDIIWNANIPHANSPEQMLTERFNLDEKDIKPYDNNIYPDILTYALNHKDKIFKKSEEIRHNYLAYMRGIGLKENKRYAFVDFVSSGTCQQTLDKFICFDIEGLYFCKYYSNNEAKLQLPGYSLFENLCDDYIYCCYAYEKYLLLETIMTSFQPSLASMDEKGQPIYRKETRNDEEIQYVRDIHQAIEDYFYDYMSNLYIQGNDVNKHFVDIIFRFREKEYTNEKCSIFDKLVLTEDFGQWRMLLDRNY